MDQTGAVVVTTTAVATTTTLAVTTGIPVMDVTRETWVISPTDLPILVLSRPGVPPRATLTQFALLVDVDTQESVVELLADKKPGASGRVFAITEGYAANTSGTITGTLFIYGHAVFVLFDTGATHYVISSAFASRINTTPTLLDHVPQDYDAIFRYAMFIYSFYLCYVLSLYPFIERYAQPYSFHVLYGRHCLVLQFILDACFLIKGVDVFFQLSRLFQTFKTLCLLSYALMIRHDYDLTSSLRREALQLWYQSQVSKLLALKT
nr:hypothetical protein [Tanacetum cinerariifolium]